MKNFVPFTEAEQKAAEKVRHGRDVAEARFPLIFGVAASLGLVSTYYGFEKLIDRSEFLVNNPWILLAVGLSTLLATGAAYRKLN